jgi:hypothetical protein
MSTSTAALSTSYLYECSTSLRFRWPLVELFCPQDDQPVAVVDRFGIDALEIGMVRILEIDQYPISATVAQNDMDMMGPLVAVGRIPQAVVGQQGIFGFRRILAEILAE